MPLVPWSSQSAALMAKAWSAASWTPRVQETIFRHPVSPWRTRQPVFPVPVALIHMMAPRVAAVSM
jgi:hypothetical protein